jgi:catechol-2,3-dioxygenase
MTSAEPITKRTTAVTPRGVNHLVINVRDMDESHRFWCELLGFVQVGELRPRAPDNPRPSMTMRFYSGVVDHVNHHDLALVERPTLPKPQDWSLFAGVCAINHIAITYPDRESWLEQVQFLIENGVEVHRRTDHGMTHSIYISDPNGYGVEVLYELPEEIWSHDINGALNWAVSHPVEQSLQDTNEYTSDFSRS